MLVVLEPVGVEAGEARRLMEAAPDALFDGPPDALYIKNQALRFVKVNEAAARVFGAERSSITGRQRASFMTNSRTAATAGWSACSTTTRRVVPSSKRTSSTCMAPPSTGRAER